MKKIISSILLFTIIILSGCTISDTNTKMSFEKIQTTSPGFKVGEYGDSYIIITYDSCEYLFCHRSYGDDLCHKGNCKHCTEVLDRKLKTIINK